MHVHTCMYIHTYILSFAPFHCNWKTHLTLDSEPIIEQASTPDGILRLLCTHTHIHSTCRLTTQQKKVKGVPWTSCHVGWNYIDENFFFSCLSKYRDILTSTSFFGRVVGDQRHSFFSPPFNCITRIHTSIKCNLSVWYDTSAREHIIVNEIISPMRKVHLSHLIL